MKSPEDMEFHHQQYIASKKVEAGPKFPKPKREIDKNYVEWIKRLRCWVTNSPHVDPHHAQRSGHGGIATKASDRRCIPLRHDLHVELHNIGAKSFATKHDLNYESIIEALNAVYERMHDE